MKANSIKDSVFFKRVLANLIDFGVFILVFIISLIIITILQKTLGIYDTDKIFFKIVNFLFNLIIIIGMLFLVFGILFSKMKKSIGKAFMQLYIHPFTGRLTPARMFIREVLLKQVFYFFIFFFLAYKVLDILNMPDIFGNMSFFIGTFIFVVILIFLILNLLSFVLVGHPVHNILLKTTVKLNSDLTSHSAYDEEGNYTEESYDEGNLDDFIMDIEDDSLDV